MRITYMKNEILNAICSEKYREQNTIAPIDGVLISFFLCLSLARISHAAYIVNAYTDMQEQCAGH